MSVGHFHIPGEATRREFAVYVMVARHRQSGEMHLYVGKTGDNKEGCNPVISRAGNHFSFNNVHSQMRNKLPATPESYDFDFFYATFGGYVDPRESREGIDVVNEMERRLNRLVQQKLGGGQLLNPFAARTKLQRHVRDARELLATPERLAALDSLVAAASKHVEAHRTKAPVIVEKLGAEDVGRGG